MEKFFRINKPAYHNNNSIRVFVEYNKNKGGYCITAELIERMSEPLGCFGKSFCAEYYKHDGDGIQLIIPCGRRSAKKQAEADDILERDAEKYAVSFLNHVNEKLGTDVVIVKE